MKTLVTGGIRSGKSQYAEALLRDKPTTYIATGPAPSSDDVAWAQRVAAHRNRRPASWATIESNDLCGALGSLTHETHGGTQAAEAGQATLVDDLGGWLTATMDALDAWDSDDSSWQASWEAQVEQLTTQIEDYGDDLVLVTSEVGLSLVSPYASGRLFADHLGLLNQRVAALCDRVVLVIAGCHLVVKEPSS